MRDGDGMGSLIDVVQISRKVTSSLRNAPSYNTRISAWLRSDMRAKTYTRRSANWLSLGIQGAEGAYPMSPRFLPRTPLGTGLSGFCRRWTRLHQSKKTRIVLRRRRMVLRDSFEPVR